jgi:hypothetical protein
VAIVCELKPFAGVQEKTMQTYEFPAPRLTFAFAAAAMTAVTIGVLVVLPSQMESDSQAYAMLAASSKVWTCAAVPGSVSQPSIGPEARRTTF